MSLLLLRIYARCVCNIHCTCVACQAPLLFQLRGTVPAIGDFRIKLASAVCSVRPIALICLPDFAVYVARQWYVLSASYTSLMFTLLMAALPID